jgi:hypothetical protein
MLGVLYYANCKLVINMQEHCHSFIQFYISTINRFTFQVYFYF